MDKPLISVILPVYNGEKYLKLAIDSILHQTLSNFELIIINDGSTDESEKIIHTFKDPRIRYFCNEVNIGFSSTLNKGIEVSRGEYIARMDADDISLPFRFEKQMEFLLLHPEIAILGTAVQLIDEKGGIFGEWKYPLLAEELKLQIKKTCCFAHPSVIFKKSCVMDIGLYHSNYIFGEDYDLWFRLLEKYPGANLPETLLQYRIHSTQMSSTHLFQQTLICCMIRNQLPVENVTVQKSDLTHKGISNKELDEQILNTFAFWIDLYVKMNCPLKAKSLLAELKKEITDSSKPTKKVFNSLEIKISLRELHLFKCTFLIMRRLDLALAR